MKGLSIKILFGTAMLAAVFLAPSCKKSKSATTGQAYNSFKWGGFENHKYKGQETGPGLVLIEGGAFTMGSSEQDVTWEYNNVERNVTVNSFYMDQTEISNIQYGEYVFWLERVFTGYPDVYKKALPDTLVWRNKLAYNEPFVEYYFRHPAYKEYPVVGVSWLQATSFAAWRTDRVNEAILDREKIHPYVASTVVDENNFNTGAYLANQYEPKTGKKKRLPRDYTTKKGTRKKVAMRDGILLPEYRLPTEAEWEYAATANIGSSTFENVDDKKIYAWNDLTVRVKEGKERDRGKILANFKRGKGDQGGIANQLNDAGIITTPVYSYYPNAYGLYNMAGNVSEWVKDVYRPLSFEDVDDFNSYRGNVFQTVKLDQYGEVEEKDSLGRLVFRNVTPADNKGRRNYNTADNIGYKDELSYNNDEQKYEYGTVTLIDNKARVYKGGSWNDRAYWMSPGTRRYLDEELSTSTIGFRCAMVRIGSPIGNSKKRNKSLPSKGVKKNGKSR
ncbi:MAG: SUMF1/EgtB/PvdO family nonheme iron enzyme [Bacteroidia bacterium]|nr:SUMF1/EgtB/PvdO family nonheme iron enzyme [Bacteroidia bacterium]